MRVANLLSENRKVKTFRDPMRIEAIPAPIRTLPRNAEGYESPKAKRKAPKAPMRAEEVSTIRGPIRSSIGPNGI